MTAPRIDGMPYFVNLSIDVQSIREFRGFAEVNFINTNGSTLLTTNRIPVYIPRAESKGVKEPFMVSKI